MANITFGERLRRTRIRNGMTQADVADKIGVTPATISNWETEKGKNPLSQEQRAQLKRIFGSFKAEVNDSHEDASVEAGPAPFGAWLNKQRLKKEMTVTELADKAKLSIPTIYGIEAGRIANPRAETVRQIETALDEKLPSEVKREVQEEANIEGFGELVDFDPHVKDDNDLPSVAGIYVLYDISERPIYIGQSSDIRTRLREHKAEKFWYRPPIVHTGAYVEIKEKTQRVKVEKLLIRFLKSNAVLNIQNVER